MSVTPEPESDVATDNLGIDYEDLILSGIIGGKLPLPSEPAPKPRHNPGPDRNRELRDSPLRMGC